jgi:hypothetical protein
LTTKAIKMMKALRESFLIASFTLGAQLSFKWSKLRMLKIELLNFVLLSILSLNACTHAYIGIRELNPKIGLIPSFLKP